MVSATDLLETCRLAEEIWDAWPEQGPLVRDEIDALWAAYEAMTTHPNESIVTEEVATLVMGAALLRDCVEPRTSLGPRTESLLAAWRRAESDLSAASPGTLQWLISKKTVDAARDRYHAWIDSIDRNESFDARFSELADHVDAEGRALPEDSRATHLRTSAT